MNLGVCETPKKLILVVQNIQFHKQALCPRRCLYAVFWHIMHRYAGQRSESVLALVCIFCTTE